MDDFEKTVLRRKRYTIAVHLQLTDEYLRLFQNSNVINDVMLDQLNFEGTNFQKVFKFLENLPHYCDTKGFQKLCQILEQEYEWLADELRAELRAERGELHIEDYIEKEASTLVFKEFGQTKRLAQNEKNAIKDIIALRTQYAKEVWQRRLDQVKDELRYLRKTNKDREDFAKSLIEEMSLFIRVHQARLKTTDKNELVLGHFTQQLISGSQLSSIVNNDKQMMLVLKEVADDLLKLGSKSLLERDNFMDERRRTLKVMDIENQSARIDVEIELLLQKHNLELESIKKQADIQEQKTTVLTEEISDVKKQGQVNLLSKEQVIQTMTMHLQHAHNKVRELQMETEHLRRELQQIQAKTDVWKIKCEKLDKTRKLGYVNLSKNEATIANKTEKRRSKTDMKRNEKSSSEVTELRSKSAQLP